MQNVLAVATGGCLGAVLRYGLCNLMQKLVPSFAASGTLLVNILGCFAIGYLFVLVDRSQLGNTSRLFLMTGVLGSLTTFSTFGLDTVLLAKNSGLVHAAANTSANIAIGFAAVCLGISCAGGLR